MTTESERSADADLPVSDQLSAAPQLALAQPASGKFNIVAALIGLNVAVFLLMICTTGLRSILIPPSQVLLKWGANTGYATLTDCQWWRLLTSSFVHAGIFHIGINLFVLRDVGKEINNWFGAKRFAVIWCFAAACGALTSLVFHPTVVSEGASAAIFGLFGAMLAFVWQRRQLAPPGSLKLHSRIILILVIYSIVCAYFDKSVDNAAHFGGLLSGFLAGWLLLPAKDGTKPWLSLDYAKSVTLLTCTISAYLWAHSQLAQAPSLVAEKEYSEAVGLLQDEKFSDAVEHLDRAITLDPANDSALLDRARALAKLKRLDKALADCDRAMKVVSDKKLVLFARAEIEHRMQHYSKANADLTSVISLDAKSAIAYNNRAWNSIAAGRYNDAVVDCERAIALDAKLSTAYDTKGTAEIMMGNLSAANDDLLKAISIKSSDGAFYYHRAVVKQRMKAPNMEDDLAKVRQYKYEPEAWEPQIHD